MWNPHVAGGMPYLTNPENSLYYPLKIPFFFLPFFAAVSVLRVLNAIVASTGMFAVLRGLRVGRLAAMAGGIMFAYGSFMAYEQVHIPYVNTTVWWPWELLCLRRLIRMPSFRRSLALSCVTAVSFFGGSPGIFVIGHVALACFAAFAILDMLLRRRIARLLRSVAGLIQAAVLCLVLTAVQWLPTLEFTVLSVRSGGLADLSSYERFAMPPEGFRALVFPWLHWLYGAPYFPLHPLPFVSVPYAGVAAVFLSLNGLFSKRYFRFLSPALVLIPIAVLMAMGSRTGFAELALRYAPALRWFRWPNDYLFVAYIVISMAAALGIDVVWREGRRGWLRLVAGSFLYHGAALFFVSGMVSWIVFAAGMAATAAVLFCFALVGNAWRPLRLKNATLALALLAIVADLFFFGSGYNFSVPAGSLRRIAPAQIIGWLRKHAGNDRVSAATTGWQLYFKGQERFGQTHLPLFDMLPEALATPLVERALRSAAPSVRSANLWRRRLIFEDQDLWSRHYPVNAAMLFGYQDISVYDPFVLRHVAEFYQKVPVERVWNLMSVRYLARPSRIAVDGMREVFHGSSGRIYENTNAFPRVWITHKVRDGLSRQSIFNLLSDPTFNAREAVLFEDSIPRVWKDAMTSQPSYEAETGRIVRYEAERVIAEVELLRPGCVVLNDIFYPGWKAFTAGGRLLKVWKAYGVLRAVFLPAGRHQIEFRYEPDLWLLGMLLSSFSWAFVFLSFFLSGWTRPRIDR